MRFKLQAAEELRNRGVEHERVEQIDVIDKEEAGALRIKSRSAPHDQLCPRELHCDSTKHTLCAVVLARIDENAEQHKESAHGKEKSRAQQPVIRASH